MRINWSVFFLLVTLLFIANSCIFSKADIESWLDARELERTYRFCHVEYTLNGEHYDIDCFGTKITGGWFSPPDYEVLFNNYYPYDSLERISFVFDCCTKEGLAMGMEADLRNESQFNNKKRYQQTEYTEYLDYMFITPPEERGIVHINCTSIINYYFSFQLIEDGHDAFMFLFDLDYLDGGGNMMELRDGKLIVSKKLAAASNSHYNQYIISATEDE